MKIYCEASWFLFEDQCQKVEVFSFNTIIVQLIVFSLWISLYILLMDGHMTTPNGAETEDENIHKHTVLYAMFTGSGGIGKHVSIAQNKVRP